MALRGWASIPEGFRLTGAGDDCRRGRFLPPKSSLESVLGLVGHAKEILHLRGAGSAAGASSTLGSTLISTSAAGDGSGRVSLHANMIHRFLPKDFSIAASPDSGTAGLSSVASAIIILVASTGLAGAK